MRHWTKGTGSFTALASLTTASASAAMMLRRSYSATAATPSHCHYTYLLSNSSSSTLYVPLTSFCNSATLPQTRGPNFVLPPEAVAALCRVRDAELRQAKWDFWCRWLDQQETLQKLPPTPETSFVAAIPEPEGDDENDDARAQQQPDRWSN